MQRMMCIKGTRYTRTVSGEVYECVGRVHCPHCGAPSKLLLFEAPVRWFGGIRKMYCCGKRNPQGGRFGHQDRFVPLAPVGEPSEAELERLALDMWAPVHSD